MSSPARSTRSRTRALRHIPNNDNLNFGSPASDAANPAQCELENMSESSASDAANPVQREVANVSASDDESLWEDVLDEGSNVIKHVRRDAPGPFASRRQPNGNFRRRKRAGCSATPNRKSGVNGLTCNSNCSPTPMPHKTLPLSLEEAPHNGGLNEINQKSEEPTRQPAVELPSTEDIAYTAIRGVSFGGRYAFDVIRTALALLRKPLSVILCLWLLAIILLYISQTLRAAFAPICWLPFLSSSIMCRPLPSPPGANYPVLVEAETKTFEQLLDESSGGSALSLEVKKAEMATADLITLVRVSNLRSRDALANMLSDFVHDAKTTGRRLQKLHSRVSGSVDIIMAVNSHALRTIENVNRKPPVISFDNLVPWATSRKQQVVTSTFNDAMDTLSTQISRLILEAEANIENLNDLEERLNALHELASREVITEKSDREELLAQLWTILGGNKKELKNFNENLATLKNVGTYRSQARLHVTVTLQTLQSLSEDMEDLRERVATPGLVGESIPLEVQVQSIQFGLERLKENRLRARRIHDKAVNDIIGPAPMSLGVEK